MFEVLVICSPLGELVAFEREELGTGSDPDFRVLLLNERPPFVSDGGRGEG